MGMEPDMFSTIDPLTEADYDRTLMNLPKATIFHTREWAQVLCRSYRYRPVYFILSGKNTATVLVPCMEIDSPLTGKRGVSLPFSDYCDPLSVCSGAGEEIFDKLVGYGKKAGWKYLELRTCTHSFLPAPVYKKYYHHVLPLSGTGAMLWKDLKDSTRRNIKKAVKEGVEIEIGQSEKEMKAYYRLHCLTRRYHGLPPQPYQFFRNIVRFLLARERGVIVLARHQGKYIAGNVYFHFGKKAFYKFGASDRHYQQYRPSNLVMWEAIKYYHQRKFSSLCFGRTDMDEIGLLRYKDGWGTDRNVIHYYRFSFSNNRFIEEKESSALRMPVFFRYLAVSILRLIGAVLYKHMG